MKIYRQGWSSLKDQYADFYEKKFKKEKTYKLTIIIIWCMAMFLLGYYIGLGL